MKLAVSRMENDTRGWIMCIVSGIACVFGASIICIDLVIRLFPGKRNFRIQESSVFLACSLSLSFGVMLFSSLYSMLPESRGYFKDEDWPDRSAGLASISCFMAGFVGIQAISRLLHRYMPSHVVDCDHSHDETIKPVVHSNSHGRKRSRLSRARKRCSHSPSTKACCDGSRNTLRNENGFAAGPLAESAPLLAHPDPDNLSSRANETTASRSSASSARPESPTAHTRSRERSRDVEPASGHRPSMYAVQQRVMSFFKDTKCDCDELGSCYGYSDPCGQECFKHLSTRSSSASRHPPMLRTTTTTAGPFHPPASFSFHDSQDHGQGQPRHSSEPASPRFRTSRATSRDPEHHAASHTAIDHGHDAGSFADGSFTDHHHSHCIVMDEGDYEAQHHHHVPENAFLSIGLQTCIAITLHKFPEGFITFATNHVNPRLGFNVFMALFVHNITEGFAMALPLYMALGSRWRAMLWSALLGGLSQPLGGALAALWFRLATTTRLAPSAVAYGGLFALTSGIMVSVALQLFVESLSLNHNRNLSISFAFLGMSLLGLSNALFATH